MAHVLDTHKAAGTESGSVIYTNSSGFPVTFGYIQITNDDDATAANVKIQHVQSDGSTLVDTILPDYEVPANDGLQISGLWTIPNGEKIAVDCDLANVTFRIEGDDGQ